MKEEERKKVTSRSTEELVLKKIPMYLLYVNFMERVEREREKFYVINVKYKEIPYGKREKKRRGGGKK